MFCGAVLLLQQHWERKRSHYTKSLLISKVKWSNDNNVWIEFVEFHSSFRLNFASNSTKNEHLNLLFCFRVTKSGLSLGGHCRSRTHSRTCGSRGPQAPPSSLLVSVLPPCGACAPRREIFTSSLHVRKFFFLILFWNWIYTFCCRLLSVESSVKFNFIHYE